MIGAVAAAGLLPITEERLKQAIREHMSADKVDINLTAFRIGGEIVN